MGVERTRYTRAGEERVEENGEFHWKIGTAERTTAAPIVDSLFKPRLLVASSEKVLIPLKKEEDRQQEEKRNEDV